jgi:hypothetical protein
LALGVVRLGVGPGRCALIVVDAAVAVDAAAAVVVVVVVAVVVVVVAFGPVGVQWSPVVARALLLGYCRPSRYALCPVLGMCVHPMYKGLCGAVGVGVIGGRVSGTVDCSLTVGPTPLFLFAPSVSLQPPPFL